MEVKQHPSKAAAPSDNDGYYTAWVRDTLDAFAQLTYLG